MKNQVVVALEEIYMENLATHEQRFLVSLFAVLVFHVLFFSIHFVTPEKPIIKENNLDIILNPIENNQDKPIEADYLAQSNQRGGGQLTQDLKTANVLANQNRQEFLEQKKEYQQERIKQKEIFTQRQSEKMVASLKDQSTERKKDSEKLEKQMAITPLQQKIIDLEAELDREARIFAKNSKRKFVNASTSKSHDAAYIKRWTKRIEQIGNKYYPEKLHRLGISGKLVLAVAIDKNGNVLDISIRQSSKNPLLDQAAIDIVKKAAPFPVIPEKVILDNKSLVITRTWLFNHGQGMLSR
ncbi:MAG: energy transducer TonB [Gammaproteobacteria bacterium]|nr:energy transducer TonB [Gammaproteobacteria bacterium]